MTENANIFSIAKFIYVTIIFKHFGFCIFYGFSSGDKKCRRIYKITQQIIFILS